MTISAQPDLITSTDMQFERLDESVNDALVEISSLLDCCAEEGFDDTRIMATIAPAMNEAVRLAAAVVDLLDVKSSLLEASHPDRAAVANLRLFFTAVVFDPRRVVEQMNDEVADYERFALSGTY